MLDGSRYFVEQRFGILDWRIVSGYFDTEQEALNELKEIAIESAKSKKKPKVIGKYTIDDFGLQRDMHIGGRVVTAYYPLDKQPIPKPSK